MSGAAPIAPPAPAQRVFARAAPWPLHDTAGTRQLEAVALAAAAPHALMARAGLSVARLARALAPHARRVVVLAGPGNNGGDGLIAAVHLHRAGVAVQVVHRADPARLPADAADAWRQAAAAGLPTGTDLRVLDGADLLIDGLLGVGTSRAPDAPIAEAIDAAQAARAPILAIDLPSGLSADHGRVLGRLAVQARWTLSLLTLKPGLFTAEGRDHAGEVWMDDLGVQGVQPVAWLGAHGQPPCPGLQPRRHAQHKGSFGDLFVVGGAPGMGGAAVLAARAALTAGAGRVYLSPMDDKGASAPWPELMQRPQVWQADEALLGRATVVCGCGAGAAVAAVLPPLLDQAGRLVLDADALNAIARDARLQARLAARGAAGAPTVLTPHPLEAARLLGCDSGTVQADRLGSARRLADATGAVVLLKGSGTVIAAPGRLPWINASGNAMLASPGSGDVLAGWIGGLWSSQPVGGPDAAWWAARTAAWLHGHAADLALATAPGAAHRPLRAGDLIDAMAAATG